MEVAVKDWEMKVMEVDMMGVEKEVDKDKERDSRVQVEVKKATEEEY